MLIFATELNQFFPSPCEIFLRATGCSTLHHQQQQKETPKNPLPIAFMFIRQQDMSQTGFSFEFIEVL